MEYFVEMTTHVPQGTPETPSTTSGHGKRDAHANSPAEGLMLRLWRPPLAPGEWRTFGLFAADDDAPVRQSWRRCRCTSGAPTRSHRCRPIETTRLRPGVKKPVEFLTTLTITVPPDTAAQTSTT